MDRNRIAVLIKIASIKFDKIANPVMSEYDITASQYRILKFLYSQESGSARVVDIERECSITHPTVLGLLSKLEENGYITKFVNPDDGRSRLVSLTDKAKDHKPELEGVGGKLDDELTENLSEEEKDQLRRLLQKLLRIESEGVRDGRE